MTYVVTQLITDAYYTSGIVSREFQTLQGSQLQDGLTLLNEILGDKTIEKGMVPYYTDFNFSAVTNQEKYYIPNLIEAETLVFYITGVRYSMQVTQRKAYFGTGRANDITSLPFNYHLERCTGGANFYLYFFPDKNYPLELWGRFRLTNVSFNNDISNNTTTANLGTCTVNGTGAITAGQLVLNGFDLQGTYASAAALVNYINTGVASPVQAQNTGAGFILTSPPNTNIYLQSAGTENSTNNVTFANFSTLNGPYSMTYTPQGLDSFYISYLKYALARRLCFYFNYIVPPGVEEQYQTYVKWIKDQSGPLDLQNTKISTLTPATSINYAQANLGKGWST